MLVLKAVELLTSVMIAVGIVTQIVIPLLQGRPIFPLFRRAGRLSDVLAEAREQVREAELEQEIQDELARAREIREGKRDAKGEETK